jgi:hypothetical protein
MKLAVTVLSLSVLIGLLAGGRLRNLTTGGIRWSPLALIGLALQLAPVPGRALSMGLLYVSFGALFVFALANIRQAGFALITLGIVLNCTVIVANAGMPVTREALFASGQGDTYTLLVEGGGAKHHVASGSDVLMPLADAIPVVGIGQVISVGDVATALGVGWLIVAGMRRRRFDRAADGPVLLAGAGVAGV